MKTKRRKKSDANTRRPEQANLRPPPLKLRRILVPLDFSGHSRRALETAVPLAKRYGGKIILVHVVQPPVALSPIPGSGQYLVPMDTNLAINGAKTHLDELAAKLVPGELLERTLVRQGHSYHEITAAARTLKVDLIVIATHGHSGLKRVLIGSTTERVVRHAHCPVLTVQRN
jgi:nucleotide-binding universal stress UspA family protein